MDLYDTDGGGSLGITEFLHFLRSQNKEVNERLNDYLLVPHLVLQSEVTQKLAQKSAQTGSKVGVEAVAAELRPYVPPTQGILHLEVIDTFTTKPCYKKMSNFDRMKMVFVPHSTSPKF